MSMPDAAAQDPQHPVEPQPVATSADAAAEAAAATESAEAAPAEAVAAAAAEPAELTEAPREPVVEQREQEVTIEKSVRYGRILIVAAVACAVIAVFISLAFPVSETAEYTKGQVVGFSALLGGGVGLLLGGILSVILGAVARRRTGTAVAIQTDVR